MSGSPSSRHPYGRDSTYTSASGKKEKNNAFAVLMATSRQRRPRRSKSRFVLCPVGCGSHFPEKDINTHIDRCLAQQEAAHQQEALQQNNKLQDRNEMNTAMMDSSNDCCTLEKIELSACTTPPSQTEMANEESTCRHAVTQSVTKISTRITSFTPEKSVDSNDGIAATTRQSSPLLKPRSTVSPPKESADSTVDANNSKEIDTQLPEKCESVLRSSPQKRPAATDAFDTMMSQARAVFSKPQKPRLLQQCFHLHENGSLSLYYNRSEPPKDQAMAWSATLTVKDRAAVSQQQCTEIALTISSSSMPGTGNKQRWVRRHSRLSVPVLKSILQKSVRRRRPLPAVRVAMELADKSLSDLLRRLPVVVLEDSTLTADFDFLVWLMVAHSKDFVISSELLSRVFGIIFQVASCPWVDRLTNAETEEKADAMETQQPCSFALLESAAESAEQLVPPHIVLLWSILIRAEYGGMRGDVEMLRAYAGQWRQRFQSTTTTATRPNRTVLDQVVAADSSSRAKDIANGHSNAWLRVPAVVHERARQQSLAQVRPLNGLDCLTLHDLCLQGVDFHCSSIIESLLADAPFCELCTDLLSFADARKTEDSSQLAAIFKRCIWTYSSGVNRRRPLIETSQDDDDEYREFWEQLVEPRVTAFQKDYLKQRLVTPKSLR